MNVTVSKQRMVSFDMLKGFAIFMVVVGHVIQYLISGNIEDKIGYRLIYSFHMPLFMAITGFFVGLGGVTKYFNIKKLYKRVMYLLTPLVVYALVMKYVLLEDSSLLHLLVNGLWFLKSAVGCTLLFVFCSWVPVKRHWIPLAISLLLSPLYLMFNMRQMYPCFVAGALLSMHMDWFLANKRKIVFITGGIYLMMLSFFGSYFWSIPIKSLIKSRDMIVWMEYLYIWGYRLVLGLSGSLMFLCLFEYLANIKFENRLIGRLLSAVGKETLWIYVIQAVILELYMARYVNLDNLHWGVFYFLAVPVISICVIALCMGLIMLSRQIWSWLVSGKQYIIRQE